jgi:pyruvate dehydrogenase E2 component (dihydrolipoamide acetyltransferase)
MLGCAEYGESMLPTKWFNTGKGSITVMPIEFCIPELGEHILETDVVAVLVKEGDRIEADQNVVELETEKAVLELPCPHAGIVMKVHVSEGDVVKVGAVILTIEATEDAATDRANESVPESPTSTPDRSTPEVPVTDNIGDEQLGTSTADVVADSSVAAPVAQGHQPPPPAGPSTRRFARELGVDLNDVTGTGRGGRITQEDVQAHVRNRSQATTQSEPARPLPSLPDFSQFGPIERQRLTKLNRTAADQLSTSWQVIPHVTQHESADITELESVRKRYMQTSGKGGPKITMTAIAIKACVQILAEMPHVNSSLDTASEELILKHFYHIGVAVDTEHGLVVPVIRDADHKSILEIADELTQLAEKARQRKLVLADMQGATFTITNLGGIGGTAFTPIVNHPEVAILGLSRAQLQPAVVDGELRERLMLPFSLSYDHRVINGADAARFVVRLAALLAEPFGLLASV